MLVPQLRLGLYLICICVYLTCDYEIWSAREAAVAGDEDEDNVGVGVELRADMQGLRPGPLLSLCLHVCLSLLLHLGLGLPCISVCACWCGKGIGFFLRV